MPSGSFFATSIFSDSSSSSSACCVASTPAAMHDAQPFAAVGVAGGLQSEAVRLVDDRLNLLERERRALTSVPSGLNTRYSAPTKSCVV